MFGFDTVAYLGAEHKSHWQLRHAQHRSLWPCARVWPRRCLCRLAQRGRAVGLQGLGAHLLDKLYYVNA